MTEIKEREREYTSPDFIRRQTDVPRFETGRIMTLLSLQYKVDSKTLVRKNVRKIVERF